MMSTSENIHVKLQVENNFRRFFVPQKIKFSELKNKISTLLALKSDFLVKYLDEENEWITITSDMELETGLTLYSEIFRILIELKEDSVTQSQFVPTPTVLQTSSSITPVESTVITPLYSSDNNVTIAMNPFASLTMNPPYMENNVNVENSVNVSTSVVSQTPPVDDNEIGTSDEKPWRKHRKNKEQRTEWKEEKKKRGGRRGGRGGGRRGGGKRGGGRRGGYKGENKEELSSNSSSDLEYEGMSVDDAKKMLNSNTEELTLLIEKKKNLKGEVSTLLESIKTEKEKVTKTDAFYELKNKLKEKKGDMKNLMGQIRSSKNRISKLREIVLTKNE